MGSKRRLSRDLIPILTKDLEEDMWYVEPFVGGCNLIDKIQHDKKIGADINKYLIALLKYVQTGNKLPEYISREEYKAVKNNKDNYEDWYVGFVGFCCSFRGLFFTNYIGNNIEKKNGKTEHYQHEQINNLLKQNLNNIKLICCSYNKLLIPDNSIIYCDLPYKSTTKYKVEEFNYDKFWKWAKDMTLKGHKVFVSEYEAPKEFECIWQKEHNKNLGGRVQPSIEKLFIYNP